uniref:DEK-C domain-containing protein n=1 Tax=Anopheles funestus TaxID=62324 RepID=A0A182RZK3_ANOFN
MTKNPTKAELQAEISKILKDANLEETAAKKVRLQLEQNLKCDLSNRKKEVDDLVMDYVNSQASDSEEEEDDDEEDEDYAGNGKGKNNRKAKGNSDYEEEEDEEDLSEEENRRHVKAGESAAHRPNGARQRRRNAHPTAMMSPVMTTRSRVATMTTSLKVPPKVVRVVKRKRTILIPILTKTGNEQNQLPKPRRRAGQEIEWIHTTVHTVRGSGGNMWCRIITSA